jgi:hypothetical protein
LITKEVENLDPAKLYSVILYGGRHYNDIETIAIFDIEEDKYIFEPFAPDFDYTIRKGLSSEKAMAISKEFISGHHAFRTSQLSKILDKEGNVIGYELRPLYFPLVFGLSDVIDVEYWQKDGKIKVTISIKKSVERQIYDSNNSKDILK